MQLSLCQMNHGDVLLSGQQLTTFNHQSKVYIGGKMEEATGKIQRAFHGTIAGNSECIPSCSHPTSDAGNYNHLVYRGNFRIENTVEID
jgi:hypothetical protein